MTIILKASSESNPRSIAGAIAGSIEEEGSAEIRAIGAGALNQAVKAAIIARGFYAPKGIDLFLTPSFYQAMIDNNEKTGIRLQIVTNCSKL